MKKNVLALSTVGLVATSLLAPAAAHAAAAPQWTPEAPTLSVIGGAFVHNGAAMTDDRTPRFEVDADASQFGSQLTVRTLEGTVLCTSTVGVHAAGALHTVDCTSTLRLPLGATRVEALLTAPGTAETSETVSARVLVAPQKPTIEVTGFDSDSNTVSFRGTSMPGADLRVGSDVDGDEGQGYRIVRVPESGLWQTTLTGLPRVTGIESALLFGGSRWYAGTHFNAAAPLTPTADIAVDGRTVRVDVRASAGDRIAIRTLDGQTLASSPRTGDVTRLTLPAPKGRAEYFVTASSGGVDSLPHSFVVQEGASTDIEAAPDVTSVDRRGSRVVIAVSGQPGATAVIRDGEGERRAARQIGLSGIAQVVVPLAGREGATLFVEQSMDGFTSEHDDVEVPAA